jgi:hypothetical protein
MDCVALILYVRNPVASVNVVQEFLEGAVQVSKRIVSSGTKAKKK